MSSRAVVEAPAQIPLLLRRCASDVVATVGPLVIGDPRGPFWWSVNGGGAGWEATSEQAWARVDAELGREKE